MEVLLTELGPYNITGNKDTQLQHSPQGPGTFLWICGEDASLHRPQTKPSVCSAPQPPKTPHLPAAGRWGKIERDKNRVGGAAETEREGRKTVGMNAAKLPFGKNDRFKTCNAGQLHIYFSKQRRWGHRKLFLKGLGLEV